MKKTEMKNRMRAIHPGEVLDHEYLKPLGLSANALAKALAVPANRISDIIRGRRGVTGSTALRLARYFRTTPEFWMNMQQAFDLRVAEREMGASLARIKPAVRAVEEPASRSRTG